MQMRGGERPTGVACRMRGTLTYACFLQQVGGSIYMFSVSGTSKSRHAHADLTSLPGIAVGGCFDTGV